MGKTTEGIKTGFTIYGAIKNKRDHNRFEDEIAHARRMAMFSNADAAAAHAQANSLRGNLGRAWHYIKQNFENIHRLFFFHNRLVRKHNDLNKKVEEQQKQIDELKQEIKKLKGEI